MLSNATELYDKLLNEVESYIEKPDIELLKYAYIFSKEAHKGQKRLSGEEYICHPIRVALILTELRMDLNSIIVALLHDVIEDCEVTIGDVEREFGTEIAFLLNGVTEIHSLARNADENSDLINRATQLILSSTDDIRVLIVRLAEKLDNMRSIRFLPKDRAERYSTRVLKIYAPLADFIGGRYLKMQLEDLAFNYLQPEKYHMVYTGLQKMYEEIDLNAFIEDVQKMLQINHIHYLRIFGRKKGIYSTYSKMKRYAKKGIIANADAEGLKGIVDKIGITVLVPSIPDCYSVLGLIHMKYEVIPGSFDDYISLPKPNGYQSLQTGVRLITEKGETSVEIQIKTEEMHNFNEYGPASHVLYKVKQFTGQEMTVSQEYLKQLNNWQDKSSKEGHRFKLKIFEEYIFVFTKDAEIIMLPKNSTPVDFAYAIHTNVGDSINGVLVNGRMVSLGHKLKTGDNVVIKVAKKKTVSSDWLQYANRNTRHEIRRSLSRLRSMELKDPGVPRVDK
jgi:guanosine-3',5'-bis(diphosphate) 3'-pyrophosphohydrolase